MICAEMLHKFYSQLFPYLVCSLAPRRRKVEVWSKCQGSGALMNYLLEDIGERCISREQ